MKPFYALLLAGVLLAAVPAHGQGLLAIGRQSDYPENVPLTYTVGVGGGYDRIDYGPGLEDVDSFFLTGGVGILYGQNDRVTKWNVGADLGVIHYIDDAQREEDLYYNARVSFNIAHEFSRRLSVSNNLYFTYEIEPDYGIGASSSRRSGQYVYGYDNLSVAYAWSERVSTTTGYTVDGIRYTDDDVLERYDDRMSHTFSQQVSYAWTRTTKLVGEYRFRLTDYRDAPPGAVNPDYTSHYILAGVDQAWSERTSVSLRAGAEFYQSDRSDEASPYVEASISYALSRQTTARLYAQAGYDGSELGLYDSRYSYRAGLIADHRFTERLTGSAGIHYVHSEFNGNSAVPSTTDDEVNASIGVSYNFWNNLSLDANYSFTTISSDTEFRDYDRHRVNLGLNATF